MKITLAIAATGLAGMGYLAAAGAPSPASYISNAFAQSESAAPQSDATRLQRLSVKPRVSTPGFGVSASDPVVLELFTSQSCSSCPPADKLAAKLARNPGLVMISRPVTYWDRLGWTDTLGRQENTDLQRAYARRKNAGSGVYTPQIVVDGHHGAVGSDERTIRRLIMRSARAVAPDVEITPKTGGGYTVAVSGQLQGSARLSLVAMDSHETVGIGRGENGGRTVTYTNVVRDEEVLGRWNGGAANFTVKPSQLRVKDADRYAVLVQRADAGRILAGRYLK